MSTYPVEHWINEEAARQIEYADYWNDAAAEREKPWWVLDGDFAKLDRYLAETGLADDLDACLAAVGRPLTGKGIDCAAGALWAAPRLLAAGPVERLYCLEYSRHRLLELGPATLDHAGVDRDRVVLAFGSFYDMKLAGGELDFAFLSQAFHHADRPEALLAELRRVVRPGGVVIVVGEHIVRPRDFVMYAARCAVSLLPARAQAKLVGEPVQIRRRLRPTADDVFPPDPVLGDHAYFDADYDRLFAQVGFKVRRVRRIGSEFQSFLLT